MKRVINRDYIGVKRGLRHVYYKYGLTMLPTIHVYRLIVELCWLMDMPACLDEYSSWIMKYSKGGDSNLTLGLMCIFCFQLSDPTMHTSTYATWRVTIFSNLKILKGIFAFHCFHKIEGALLAQSCFYLAMVAMLAPLPHH